MKKLLQLLFVLLPVLGFSQIQDIDVYDNEYTDIEITRKVLSDGEIAIHIQARVGLDGNVSRRAIGGVKYRDLNGDTLTLFDFVPIDVDVENQIEGIEYSIQTAISVPETIIVGQALDDLPSNNWDAEGYQYTTHYSEGNYSASAFYIEFDWLNFPESLFYSGPVDFIIDGRSENINDTDDVEGSVYNSALQLIESCCTDSAATNYNQYAIVDDGSCYLDVYEGDPNQDITYTNGYFGNISIEKYITNEGGFRIHVRALMGMNHFQDGNYAVKAIGDYACRKTDGTTFTFLNYDASTSNGGAASVAFAGGMIVNLYGNYNANNLYGNNSNYLNEYSYYYDHYPYTKEYIEFDWQPYDYTQFLDGSVEFILNNWSYRPADGGGAQGNSHISDYLNIEPLQSDYGSIETHIIPESSIIKTDNEITISNDFFESTSGFARVTKAVKRIHVGEDSFNDIDGDNTNDLQKVSPSNNSYTFDSVGPSNDNVYGAYEIWIGDINYSSSSLRKYVIDNVQTLPYIPPSSILAINDENGYVNISWTKESSIPTSELIYYVDRGVLAEDGESIIWNEGGADSLNARYVYNGSTGSIINRTNNDLAYVGDDEFSYTDLEADSTKTYIYRIRTAGATDNVYYDGLDGENAVAIGTGAGIMFFNETEVSLNELSGIEPICGGFNINGTQTQVVDSIITINEQSFSFNPEQELSTNNAVSQKMVLYTDGQCENEYSNSGSNYTDTEGGISSLEYNDLEIVSDSAIVLYARIRSTRSDGKVFESFMPYLINGEIIEVPESPSINEVGSDSYSSKFEDYNKLYINLPTTSVIDKIKVTRTNTDSEMEETVVVSVSDLVLENGYYLFIDNFGLASFALPEVCVPYTYSIQAINCVNQYSLPSDTIILIPQVNQDVFDDSKRLNATKGDYGDRVFLDWDNNNDGIITSYKIQRKQLDDAFANWVNIAEVPMGTKSFTDIYAASNVLYHYKVIAVISGCESTGDNAGYTSNIEVGFRRPTARVVGRVTYENNDPVENVYVNAEPNYFADQQSFNHSLALTNTAIEIPDFSDNVGENGDNSFTLNFWYNNNYTESAQVLSLANTWLSGVYMSVVESQLNISNNNILTVGHPINNLHTIDIDSSNAWSYISLVYQDLTVDTLRLYVNGNEEITYIQENNLSLEVNSNTALFFGYFPNTMLSNIEYENLGFIDEISLFNRALTVEEIAYNQMRFITNIDDDLAVYYPCDEGVGNVLYDFSSSSIEILNKNHVDIQRIDVWEVVDQEVEEEFVLWDSLTIWDETDQLFSDNVNESIGFIGITDAAGFYDVDNIRYVDNGSNFSITPYTRLEDYDIVHEFEPNSLSMFIGDDKELQTDINFTDKTSVLVSGSVLFDVEGLISMDTTQIGVEGVTVLLNGEEAQAEDGVLLTDEVGNFSLSVPIGYHCISFEKDGYSFINDDENNYCRNFNVNMETDLGDFSCNTSKILRGRVTGGLSYNGTLMDSIALGFDYPANTIGQVSFDLSLKDMDTDHILTVLTNDSTGEYMVETLPLEYSVDKNTFISSNYLVESYYTAAGYLFESIDMSVKGENNSEGNFEEELISSTNDSLEHIEFHNRYDLTYRKSPSISLSQYREGEWDSFLGEESYSIDDIFFDLKDEDETLISEQYVLGSPVFKELYGEDVYQLLIEVREEYINYGLIQDGHPDVLYAAGDSYYHPVDEGTLNIENEMLVSGSSSVELDGTELYYTFVPDNPHVFGLDVNYQRKLVVDYQDETINASLSQEVYLFGTKAYGNDFITLGPDLPDMILRDPPGDGSYSWIEEGSTVKRTQRINKINGVTDKQSYEWGVGYSEGQEFGVSVGSGFVNFTTSDVPIEMLAEITGQFENTVSASKTKENEISISETFTETILTSGADFSIGVSGDVFIGRSSNLNFGTAKRLYFIEKSNCDDVSGIYECVDNDSVSIIGANDVEYSLGTKTMPNIRPGTNTKFAYSAYYIEDYLLPKLEFIRNTYLIGEYNVFVGKDPATIQAMIADPCWGEGLSSSCFSENSNSILANNYYEISEESDITYQMPQFGSYSNEQMAHILGSSLEGFQNGLNTATTNSGGTDYMELLTYSVGTSDFNDFMASINTDAGFNVSDYDDESNIDELLGDFKKNQDFTNIPGVLNLDAFIGGLDNTDSPSDAIIILADKVQY